MNIYVSGVNYKTTPLEIRERLSFTATQQRTVLSQVHKLDCVEECVLVSTCNRTEIYIFTENRDFSHSAIEELLCRIKDLNLQEFKKYFYFYSGVKAVRHLFKVACGLDSLVLGEDQILGQVKSAHELSLEMRTSSGVLNTLFRQAVTAAKKVKTCTDISKNSLSIGSLAIKLVENIFGGKLEDKCAMIIGAGKIGSIALKHLNSRGIGKIYVTNRTHGKAEDLSKIYRNVCPIAYNDRYSAIRDCDVVISSTSSPHYTITRDMLEKSVDGGRERVFIDLAVPRDLDVEIKNMPGVRYFNIDDLKATAEDNIDRRLVEARRAEHMIDEYVSEFEKWYEFRRALPVVRDIQNYTRDMLNDKINHTMAKLKCASEEDRAVVKTSITNAVEDLLNKLIYSVRECGRKEDIQAYFRCLGAAMNKEFNP
ncbi:MAG: glutamyl-tRNA reductase [Clostridiales bacterium]|jgi:glutamyl-tRNA reductase|nr:glutamyl-tRNA reductase [Eubacteriales bacterium]MDH7565730.1 glutamyl-tRNA reductase [Clostridiales bacterium]